MTTPFIVGEEKNLNLSLGQLKLKDNNKIPTHPKLIMYFFSHFLLEHFPNDNAHISLSLLFLDSTYKYHTDAQAKGLFVIFVCVLCGSLPLHNQLKYEICLKVQSTTVAAPGAPSACKQDHYEI